ncbi:hypothetical protein NUSPORA_01923 [Nucleospora cyclopteri]
MNLICLSYLIIGEKISNNFITAVMNIENSVKTIVTANKVVIKSQIYNTCANQSKICKLTFIASTSPLSSRLSLFRWLKLKNMCFPMDYFQIKDLMSFFFVMNETDQVKGLLILDKLKKLEIKDIEMFNYFSNKINYTRKECLKFCKSQNIVQIKCSTLKTWLLKNINFKNDVAVYFVIVLKSSEDVLYRSNVLKYDLSTKLITLENIFKLSEKASDFNNETSTESAHVSDAIGDSNDSSFSTDSLSDIVIITKKPKPENQPSIAQNRSSKAVKRLNFDKPMAIDSLEEISQINVISSFGSSDHVQNNQKNVTVADKSHGSTSLMKKIFEIEKDRKILIDEQLKTSKKKDQETDFKEYSETQTKKEETAVNPVFLSLKCPFFLAFIIIIGFLILFSFFLIYKRYQLKKTWNLINLIDG